MGGCMSYGNSSRDHEKPLNSLTAKLILMDGSIKEFSEPVKCGEIVGKYWGHFICASGGLYSGEYISEVLDEENELKLGELYFLLPNRKLEFVLTDSDMAAMLLKANVATQQRRKSKGKVQPLFHIPPSQVEDNPTSSVCCLSKSVSTGAMGGRKQRKQSKLETIFECS